MLSEQLFDSVGNIKFYLWNESGALNNRDEHLGSYIEDMDANR